MRPARTAKPLTAPPAIAPTFVVECCAAGSSLIGVLEALAVAEIGLAADDGLAVLNVARVVDTTTEVLELNLAVDDVEVVELAIPESVAVANQDEFRLKYGAASDGLLLRYAPVSYTHLTLPTKRIV